MKTNVDLPLLNLFYSLKKLDQQTTESHFYSEGNHSRNFFTSKPLNPAFEALFLVSIMLRLNYF